MRDAQIKRLTQIKTEIAELSFRFWKQIEISCELRDNRPHYFIKKLPKVPEEIHIKISEFLHHTKSILDHIAFEYYEKNPQTRIKKEKVYFHIYDSIDIFDQRVEEIKDISEEFYSYTKRVKPIKEKFETLWQVGKLNNVTKHRYLDLAVASNQGVDIGPDFQRLILNLKGVEFLIRPAKASIHQGSVLFVNEPGSSCTENRKFLFNFEITESEVCTNKPLVPMLDDCIKELKELLEL